MIVCIDWQVCDLFVKLFVLFNVILKIPSLMSLRGTTMIYGLAHVLIDDHVSRIMDIGISNQ